MTLQFYSDTLQTMLNRAYNSLEWCLNSPPKPHAFVSLPLQSTVPGRKCPECLKGGYNVWVIPGKCCPQCGAPVNRVALILSLTILFSIAIIFVGPFILNSVFLLSHLLLLT